MRKTLIGIFLFAVMGVNAQPEVQYETVVPQTFEFVQRGNQALQMDVYRPANPRPDSACVLFMFGGGFVTGRRTADSLYFCQLADRGFTVVSIDYRLHLKEVDFDTVGLFNMQGVFRDAINIAASDCAAAIAFVCNHAESWGIASNRIVLSGSSAGAIAVLQLDYCRANSLPPAEELPTGFVPAAVVPYAGAVYAVGGTPQYRTPPAPTFFMHGTKDRIVNYRKFPPVLRSGLYGPKKLQRLFEKNDYCHWIFRFEGIGHEVATVMRYTLPEFCAFVDAALSGRIMSYDATVRDRNINPTDWTSMSVFDLYRKD